MPDTEMIIVVTLAIALVLVVALGLRAFNIRSLHRTVMVAIEKGSPEVPALIDRLGRGPRISQRLIAYVLLAITAAMLGVGLMEGSLKDFREALEAAIFPGFVGIAILFYLRGADRAGDA